MHRFYPSFATFLACTYAALIAYASLYPFSGWQTSGLPLFDFLGAPWPRDRRPDDLISNILGYIPLGFLVTMALRHHTRRWTAALLAVLLTTSLSFSVEFLQNLLPSRVASNVDLGSNALGGLIGALIGVYTTPHLLGQRGHLHRLRRAHVVPGRAGELGLILVALWLIAQAQPLEAPFNGGMLGEHFDWTSPLAFSATAFMRIEAFTVACSCLATGFFVMTLVHHRPLLATWTVVACGLLIKSGASWLFLVPGDALGWATPGSLAGIAISLVLLSLASWLPPRSWRPLAVAFLILMVAGSNLLPVTPYDVFGPSLARRGNGINFLGMANGLALLWPALALAFLASLRWSNGYRARRAV